MKKIITIFCISISFILCGVIMNKDSVMSEEKVTMTMTELYENGIEATENMIITIESKEEMAMFSHLSQLMRPDYILNHRPIRAGTIKLIKDISLSDFYFEMDEETNMFGINKENQLIAVFDQINNIYYKDFDLTEVLDEDAVNHLKKSFEDSHWDKTISIKQDCTFDGNGHTIYGWVQQGDDFYQVQDKKVALFREIYGEVKNLTIAGSMHDLAWNYFWEDIPGYIYYPIFCNKLYGKLTNCKIEDMCVNSYRGWSGIVNEIYEDAVIQNCDVEVYGMTSLYKKNSIGILLGGNETGDQKNIQINDTIIRGKMIILKSRCENIEIGGIAGKQKGSIVNCKNYADIECKDYEGYKGEILYAGGIVAECNDVIKDCDNEGNIYTENSYSVGGIASYVSENSKVVINGCTNRGTLTSAGTNGGILGKCEKAYIRIINCINEGKFEVSERVDDDFIRGGYINNKLIEGGLLGYSNHFRCYIINCANKSDAFYNCGAFIGRNQGADYNTHIVNTYNLSKTLNQPIKYYDLWNDYSKIDQIFLNCYMIDQEQYGREPYIYGFSESQLLGTETEKLIADSGYASTCSLKDALNNWILSEGNAEHYGWIDGKNGPELKRGWYLIEPTPTPTMEPTATPTLEPEETPKLEPTMTPTIEPTMVPTPTPDPTPTITPDSNITPEPSPSATPDPTRYPDVSGNTVIIRPPVSIPTQTPKPSSQTESGSKKKSKKMRAPTFTLKKKKTASGRRYVQIRIKKYEGKYIEIKVKKKSKFYKLKLKNGSIKKNKKVFNFSYSSQQGTLTFKIRTYTKKKNKKVYSKESKKKRISLS